ncbi:MAG: ribosome small subunit-dependent GTPase A [Deltaproteobacteria bacterium]|nr:ribosome small subunit-dependent GTPase A [Deltaproteobacteria bacterium]MBN2673597.1 ribosome small subunit-dependent GTPase A [Deltaproteobacteria bacterium]
MKTEPTGNAAMQRLGWSDFFQRQLEPEPQTSTIIGRVIGVRRNYFLIHDGTEERLVQASGSLAQKSDGRYAVIGDWVLVTDTRVDKVLPRRNYLSRGAAGGRGKQNDTATKEQLIAANVDSVMIVCGLDRDFNLRRIERYLTLVYNCGLNPEIILTKADMHENPFEFEQQVQSIAFGVPVHLIFLNDDTCLTHLQSALTFGTTAALIGSSGAGKSTLINRLLGHERQSTAAVSDAVGKGRHTTTTRDLLFLPSGGMLIDNPGIREVALGDSRESLETAFPDIDEYAALCRFHDCSHTSEPGCMVQHHIEEGTIKAERLESYNKMQRELQYNADREHKSANRIEKENRKWIAVKVKQMKLQQIRSAKRS